RPFLYLFTSGTTGTPKICPYTVWQFAARSAPTSIGPATSDRQLAAVRWPALAGLRILFRIHAVGGTFVNAPFPESKQQLARLVSELGVTQLVATPWQMRRLLMSETPPGSQMTGLRALQVTGAITSPQEVLEIRKTITPNLYNVYGCNEIGFVSCLRPEDP